jgi:hypothetical protein
MQDFTLKVKEPTITLRLYNLDPDAHKFDDAREDLIGSIEISLEEIVSAREVSKWFKLDDQQEIYVKFSLPPIALPEGSLEWTMQQTLGLNLESLPEGVDYSQLARSVRVFF